MKTQPQLFSLSPALVGFIQTGINPAIPRTVNLILFFGLLYFLLRKPTREFFSQRYQEIRASLEQAAREKEAATAKLTDIDARLNKLDAELAEIRAQAERESEAERQRIEAQSRQDAEKLRLMTQREIESAKNSALAELQQFTAARSVEFAEQLIRRELTTEDDARLVSRMSSEIQKVSQSVN